MNVSSLSPKMFGMIVLFSMLSPVAGKSTAEAEALPRGAAGPTSIDREVDPVVAENRSAAFEVGVEEKGAEVEGIYICDEVCNDGICEAGCRSVLGVNSCVYTGVNWCCIGDCQG